MKKIIIAEKPSVAQEYAKVLGVSAKNRQGFIENDTWIVTWTVGHLVTLSYPEKYNTVLKEWKMDTLPFIPDNYKYEIIDATKKQFEVVKKLYNRPDIGTIYYAGDSGREGLYIQMLVRMLAGHNPQAQEKVVWINSQTEDEILNGISEAKSLTEYKNMSDAAYMRGIADYLVGINFSRILSILYAPMLNTGSSQKNRIPISIGRVMTCVLGMVVRREQEIANFKVKNFYRITGNIEINRTSVECEWKLTESSNYFHSPKLYSEFGFNQENDALELINSLNDRITITSVEKKIEKKNAPLLYNLAELQSECSKLLHISPVETLNIAQSLYEKKVTTYPRTDARVLSSAVAKSISKNVYGLKDNEKFRKYVMVIESNNYTVKGKYVNDSKITDHYAIIPTGKSVKDLTMLENAIYEMIVLRFLSVFYPPAEFEVVRFDAKVNNELFSGSKKVLEKPGFYDVIGIPNQYSDNIGSNDNIKSIQMGKSYKVSYETKKGMTEPPKRYTSGSIIIAMENAGQLIEDDELREQIKSNGIGTSATRADIINKLIKLHYINLNEEKQILTPTSIGNMIYEVVNMEIPELLSPEITAKWEKQLTEISNGLKNKIEFEREFNSFVREICNKIKENSSNHQQEVKKRIIKYATGSIRTEYTKFDSWDTKLKCPLCGNKIETTEWGFKCKSNVNKKEGCTFAIGGDILNHRLLTNELATLLNKGKAGPFYDFLSHKNKPFAAYLILNKSNNHIEFELTDMPWDDTNFLCPKCKHKILKQGNLYKCENYIDQEHGCSFWLGKIAGKSLVEKNVEKLLTEGKTELIRGFKTSAGTKFDAFLYLDSENNVKFKFPEIKDLQTEFRCPICHGKILETSYGFKCENFKGNKEGTENDCNFFAGRIMGHAIKKKELSAILQGIDTDLITFKNSDKKSFEARLYWDNEQKRISFKFDDNSPINLNIMCPICGKNIQKNKYGYFCSGRKSRTEGCQFYLGNIAGIQLEDTQVKKLLENGKTDLITGFKPRERGKSLFSAYLKWDEQNQKICFEFPDKNEITEKSSYTCPICQQILRKNQSGYYCECGLNVYKTISSVEIPEEQIKKLLLCGRTDIIHGFFSQSKRKLFSARLVVDKENKRVAFSFLDMPHKNGGTVNEG